MRGSQKFSLLSTIVLYCNLHGVKSQSELMKIINSVPPLLFVVKVAAFQLIGPKRLKPFIANKCRLTSTFIPLHMSIVTEEKMHEGKSTVFTEK